MIPYPLIQKPNYVSLNSLYSLYLFRFEGNGTLNGCVLCIVLRFGLWVSFWLWFTYVINIDIAYLCIYICAVGVDANDSVCADAGVLMESYYHVDRLKTLSFILIVCQCRFIFSAFYCLSFLFSILVFIFFCCLHSISIDF